MASATKENYLKTIYLLQQKIGKVSLTDISKALEISPASTNNMIQKLKKLKLVEQEKYQPVKLTTQGESNATSIIRKHRLSEMYLTEIMGIGWESVHTIAEEMEHIDSTILFDRMDELLNYPKFDPHGSPIPDKEGKFAKTEFKLLSEMNSGDLVQLVGIEESSKELLQLLNLKNIKLGTKINILEITAFDKSLTVKINNKEAVMLSSRVCNSLRVKK